jgi:anti-sigma regulatory factor (Ser/Thr protein kinase)
MSALAAELLPGPARFRMVVPGIVTERPRVLRFVVGACRTHGLSADVEESLVSALGEAFNHAVLDSYGRDAGTVTVELEVGAGRVTALVRDRGAGASGAYGSERHAERRFGLFIMLRAMDEVRWWRDGVENIVAMSKRLPRQKA